MTECSPRNIIFGGIDVKKPSAAGTDSRVAFRICIEDLTATMRNIQFYNKWSSLVKVRVKMRVTIVSVLQ